MYTIFPSLSTTNVDRLATPADSIRTPYALVTSRFAKSLSMGIFTSFLFANSFWEGVLSVLIPKTLVSDASNLAIPAWYAVISLVQPPVKAAGKKARTTLNLPRKSLSVTLPPAVELSVKSGAISPSFRWVLGGGVAWPKRLVASVAPSTMKDSLFTFGTLLGVIRA